MRRMNCKSTAAGVLGGFSMCALVTVSAMGQSRERQINPAMEQVGDPLHPVQIVRTPPSVVTGGGLAGLSPIIHDNGQSDTPGACNPTGVCAPPGNQSTLQNVAPLALNVFGFTANATFQIADDFTLTSTADLQQIQFDVYNTGATTVTVTAASVSLLADAGGTPGAVVPGCGPTTTLFSPITLANVYRSLPLTACNRNLQRIVMDVSSWPDVPAGTYWVSMQATAPAGPFMPPVTICDACGKPGANAFQFNAGVWGPLNDTGVGGCAATPRQDVPFIVRGDVAGPTCPGDTDGDGDVDADDLVNVVLGWGACPAPPAPCPGDTDDDGDVDADDLVNVVLGWGPC